MNVRLDGYRRLMDCVPALACAWLVVGMIGSAVAQTSPVSGITVTGTGSASARPDAVEITGTVEGSAERGADAAVKFRDARRVAMEGLKAVEMQGLSVEGGGVALTRGGSAEEMAVMMNGGEQTNAEPATVISEPITVRLAGIHEMEDQAMIETLTKLLDTAKEAGLKFGPNVPPGYGPYMTAMSGDVVRFTLNDSAGVKQEAYAAAMKEATAAATRLAELSGGKLGRIEGVEQVDESLASPENPMQAWMAMMTGEMGEGNRGGSTRVEMKVTLRVRFELVRGEGS